MLQIEYNLLIDGIWALHHRFVRALPITLYLAAGAPEDAFVDQVHTDILCC